MEESNYCILCQEQHITTAQCMECKNCGVRGHVRKDCPRGVKRKEESREKNSSLVSKAAKLSPMEDSDIVIIDISGSSVHSCYEDISDANICIQEENRNVIHISDDGDEETQVNNNNVSTIGSDDSTGKTVVNAKRGHSGVKPKIELKKTDHDLEPGKYSIVAVHIELFRSSKHSSTTLTQIGCVVHGYDDSFFKSIKPSAIDEYLDCYKLGGDLLQALHMTREDDGTFLFRKQFEDVEKCNKVICIDENEAILSLLKYLQKYPNCLILGVDEDTVAILAKKVGKNEIEKSNVIGFTYWKRVLKYLDVEDYKNIDLEDYCGDGIPCYKSALDIAKILMKSVEDISSQKKCGRKSMQCDFFKLCKIIKSLSKPKRHVLVREKESGIEHIEVYSSFRPTMTATISAKKLEQIFVSESDSEPVEFSDSKSDSENSSSITGAYHLTLSKPKDSSELKETGGRQDRQERSNMIETETEKRQAGQPSAMLLETREIQVGQANVSTEMNTGRSRFGRASGSSMISTGNNQVGRTTKGTEINNTSANHWKLAESRQENRGVICPWCRGNGANVLLMNIHDHIARIHTNKVGKSLLCPKCNAPVLPSLIYEHIETDCIAPAPRYPSNSSTFWKIKNINNRGYCALCPWCNVSVNLRNIFSHVAKVHKKERFTRNKKCPSCDQVVLPSEVHDHIPSCVPLILNNIISGSSTQVLPKNTNQSKSTSKPSQEASQPPPSHEKKKCTLISPKETSKPPAGSGSDPSKLTSKPSQEASQPSHSNEQQTSTLISPACAPALASSGPQCDRQPVSAAQVNSLAIHPSASPNPLCFTGKTAINLPSPSIFPRELLLPGMIVTEDDLSVSRLKISLECFIFTKFRPVSGGSVHFLWMYEQYQRTMLHVDQKVVVSPVAFSTLVTQICERIWGVLVGRSESRYGDGDSQFQFCFDGIMHMPIQE